MGKQLYNDIKDERISNNLTQADVAAKLHCFPQYVCDVEKGRKNLTVKQVEKHLKACGSKKKIRIQ